MDPESDDDGSSGPGGKPKRWSKSDNEEYFMNILIRTCCEVIESGRTLNNAMIQLEVMEGWHTRCGVVSVVWCVLRLTFNYFPL